MQLKHLFLVYIVLCLIAFFDVLFKMRKNSMLKICILVIITSLFAMNYFSYLHSLNRFQILMVKCMRIVYACSTMLIIIQRVTPKVPGWIIGTIASSAVFLIGIRIYYFDRIATDIQSPFASQIFSVGPELDSPVPLIRHSVYALVAFVTGLTFYFYRKFFISLSIDDNHSKVVSRWILLLAIPFFFLIIFCILGSLQMYDQPTSAYLFSIFSFIVVFSILFRPKLLNNTSFFQMQSNGMLYMK